MKFKKGDKVVLKSEVVEEYPQMYKYFSKNKDGYEVMRTNGEYMIYLIDDEGLQLPWSSNDFELVKQNEKPKNKFKKGDKVVLKSEVIKSDLVIKKLFKNQPFYEVLDIKDDMIYLIDDGCSKLSWYTDYFEIAEPINTYVVISLINGMCDYQVVQAKSKIDSVSIIEKHYKKQGIDYEFTSRLLIIYDVTILN